MARQAVVVQVIKLISQVIADFANGEISQATALFDTDLTIEAYLEKSFFKTASLIAASCRSAAVFSECDEDTKAAMFAYGKHLGLAFQVRPTRCRACACALTAVDPVLVESVCRHAACCCQYHHRHGKSKH